MVAGIVLAAGMSTRMGELKPLLPFEGKPAIRWIVEVLSQSLEQVVVVLGHRAGEIAPALLDTSAQCIVNSAYREGMLSSVQCALKSIDEKADYMICLGDQPRLNGEVVEQVLAAAEAGDRGIYIPTFAGKRGHPILIDNVYRTEILRLPLDLGLNVVTRGHPEDTCEIPVAQAAILDDMDTPADYLRELEQWPNE